MGRRAVAIQADLENPSAASALLDRAQSELGPVDWLINSAAIFEPLDLAATTAEAWDRHIAINLRAPFLLAQSFASQRAGRPGAIVNILDWRALRPAADHFPYTIAKAGLAAMTRSLAVGLAPEARSYLIPAHRSQELGHRIMLDWLGLKPLLDLDLRLGEGTGAAIGISLAEAACKILSEMATFSEAGVSDKE